MLTLRRIGILVADTSSRDSSTAQQREVVDLTVSDGEDATVPFTCKPKSYQPSFKSKDIHADRLEAFFDQATLQRLPNLPTTNILATNNTKWKNMCKTGTSDKQSSRSETTVHAVCVRSDHTKGLAL